MTRSQVREAIEGALGAIPFEPPATVAYCAQVRDDLRGRLPEGAVLDVYHRAQRELVVEARVDGVVDVLALPLV